MNRFLLTLWCALLALPLSAAPLLNSYTQFPSGGGGSGPTLIAQDNFDSYTDAVSLGDQTGWAAVSGSVSVIRPSSDGTTAGSVQAAARSTATYTANQRSELTCDTLVPGSFVFPKACVRMQSGADTYYWFQTDGTNWYLCHREAGGTVNVLQTSTHSITSGAKIALEATGAGSATRLTAQVDTGGGWVNVTGAVSIDPGSGKYIDGGSPGIGGDGGTGARGDDWKGYNLP